MIHSHFPRFQARKTTPRGRERFSSRPHVPGGGRTTRPLSLLRPARLNSGEGNNHHYNICIPSKTIYLSKGLFLYFCGAQPALVCLVLPPRTSIGSRPGINIWLRAKD